MAKYQTSPKAAKRDTVTETYKGFTLFTILMNKGRSVTNFTNDTQYGTTLSDVDTVNGWDSIRKAKSKIDVMEMGILNACTMVITDNSFYGIKKGDAVRIIDAYWRNGEGQLVCMVGTDPKPREIPDIFVDVQYREGTVLREI